jgi:signal transduction histidine kinase
MSPRQRRDCLENATRHCERLGRLISELMELAKYESCEIQPIAEKFNLAELLSDIVQKFRLPAENKGVRIDMDIPDGLPFVVADIAMIERVLENLLENAIHHTPSGGKVALELDSRDKDVSVRVKDTGKGISPKDIPRIFERFYRSGKNRPADATHSGLGLAISRSILRLHDRDLTVDSAMGKGAAFSFSLDCDN